MNIRISLGYISGFGFPKRLASLAPKVHECGDTQGLLQEFRGRKHSF